MNDRREQWLAEEARLIILRVLAEEVNESLNSNLIVRHLRERFGIPRDRPWIHRQLDYLREMDAITLVDAESVKIATLANDGHRHLRREVVIEGVKRPSRPGE